MYKRISEQSIQVNALAENLNGIAKAFGCSAVIEAIYAEMSGLILKAFIEKYFQLLEWRKH